MSNHIIAIDHGGNRTNWTEQVEAFTEHLHTAPWDARGYRDSDDYDYDGPLDFGEFARDLKRLLDHFGAERAQLSGLSMGGRIAHDPCDAAFGAPHQHRRA